MTNWYYYNEHREKIAVTGGELKQLALKGTVMPETFVETPDGRTGLAKDVKGLTFPEIALLVETDKARQLLEEQMRLQQEVLELERQKLAFEQEKIKLEREQLEQMKREQTHSPPPQVSSYYDDYDDSGAYDDTENHRDYEAVPPSPPPPPSPPERDPLEDFRAIMREMHMPTRLRLVDAYEKRAKMGIPGYKLLDDSTKRSLGISITKSASTAVGTSATREAHSTEEENASTNLLRKFFKGGK